jgi:acyl-CoA thioesterase-1
MAGLAAIEVSFMRPSACPGFGLAPRSYGKRAPNVQRFAVALTVLCLAVGLVLLPARAAERPVKVVAFGDSLTAGYQLPAADTFPVRLEQALKAKGLAVEIVNAGVSGDTSSGGLSRLDWSVPEGTDAVILELGANDALRGIAPEVTRAALDEIVGRLKARGIEVLLCGMLAPPNMGPDYARAFNPIYPDLAARHGVALYPFFLDGVAANPKLNQRDGMHPTADGVAAIVTRMLPAVEALLARARARRGS